MKLRILFESVDIESVSLTIFWREHNSDPEALIFVADLASGQMQSGLASKYRSHTELRRKLQGEEGVTKPWESLRGFWIPSAGIIALYQYNVPIVGLRDPSEDIFQTVESKLGVSRQVMRRLVIE